MSHDPKNVHVPEVPLPPQPPLEDEGLCDNLATVWAIRAIKAQALREAARAYAGNDPVVVEFLLFRADEIESGDRS